MEHNLELSIILMLEVLEIEISIIPRILPNGILGRRPIYIYRLWPDGRAVGTSPPPSPPPSFGNPKIYIKEATWNIAYIYSI